MKEKCIGCPWGIPTLSDEDGIPYQVFCLPHEGGCERKNDSSEIDQNHKSK